MNTFQRLPLLATWTVLVGLHVPSASLAQVQDLGSPPNRTTYASQISANGRVSIGPILFNHAFFAGSFRFTDADGFEALPPLNGVLGTAVDVSDDGTYIAGNVVGLNRAVRWTEAGAPLDLGQPNSSASAISGDGSTIVGASPSPGSGNYRHAFRWTVASGMVDIHPAFSTLHSIAEAVSSDGTVVVGSADVAVPSGGSNSTAFLWSAATGAIDLGAGVADDSFASAVSDDGSVVVGTGRFGTPRDQAFVWTATTGMVPLGELGTDPFVYVTVSGDGSTVLGSCSPVGFRWTQAGGLQTFSGSPWFAPHRATPNGETLVGAFTSSSLTSDGAAIWTAATGVMPLSSATGPDSVAYDISADGASVVGRVVGANGLRAARWRADGTIGEPYCDPAVANSVSATGAHLTLGGSNQVADQALEMNVTDLPLNTFGFFLASRARAVILNPGGSQGTLCLGASVGRFVGAGQIKNSGPQGAFSLTVDPNAFPSPTGPVVPSFGETWHFQAWYRDANPGVTSNFSSAASVPIY